MAGKKSRKNICVTDVCVPAMSPVGKFEWRLRRCEVMSMISGRTQLTWQHPINYAVPSQLLSPRETASNSLTGVESRRATDRSVASCSLLLRAAQSIATPHREIVFRRRRLTDPNNKSITGRAGACCRSLKTVWCLGGDSRYWWTGRAEPWIGGKHCLMWTDIQHDTCTV